MRIRSLILIAAFTVMPFGLIHAAETENTETTNNEVTKTDTTNNQAKTKQTKVREGVKAHLVKNHDHKKGCGHEVAVHGGHQDFIHGGVYHALHDDHYDEHGVVVGKTETQRELASTHHLMVKNHTHHHGEGCGHEAVDHQNHKDYLHDGVYCCPHEDHVDNHGLG